LTRLQDLDASTDWQRRDSYHWTTQLPRRAWAWELLRRNADYRAAWSALTPSLRAKRHISGIAAIKSSIPDANMDGWGLIAPFENPDRDAREANVFWSSHVCRTVLPVMAIRGGEHDVSDLLPLTGHLCRTLINVDASGRQHVLFTHDGRSLQLEVRGVSVFEAERLLVDIPPPAGSPNNYFRALKQFSDFMRHGELRRSLYPPYSQGRRLAEVIQALDGWRQGATHRKIAQALVGEERFERDWRHQRSHLLNRVRRAIKRGRVLIAGDYRRFLA